MTGRKPDFVRIPPHSDEAEISVLGGILLDQKAFHKISWLSESDFYKEAHKIIYKAIKNLSSNDKPIDQVSLTETLARAKRLEEVGGAYFITGLSDSVPSAANIEYWAKIVKNKSDYRRLILSSNELQKNAYDGVLPIDELKQNLLTDLESMQSGNNKIIRIDENIESFVNEINDIHEGNITFVPTGFPDFDHLKGGYRKGNLVTIAARPRNGKTSKAAKEAVYQAKNGYRVGFFSFEMSMNEIMEVILQIETSRSYDVKNKEDFDAAIASLNIFDINLFLDDSFNSNINEVCQRIRIMKSKYRVDIVYIDYLQLMKSNEKTDRERLANITRSLKLLAKQLDIVIVILSQISRGGADRPRLEDLKGSGTIEEDSDIVFIIHTPAQEMNNDFRQVEYHVAKYRKGPVRKLDILFHAECTNFLPVTSQMDPGF